MTKYIQAVSAGHLQDVKSLFMEYAATLGCSPCLQNIEQEVDHLPGEYARPEGSILLADDDGAYAGCVALRKVDGGICEMRRLYLRPAFRGRKIGRGLAEALINEARRAGYNRMRLYTLPSMKEAISLYRSLGFKDIPPYGQHIIPDALYMELRL
jgi:ribosomal protein S18 acetylase RimI-like enzyme